MAEVVHVTNEQVYGSFQRQLADAGITESHLIGLWHTGGPDAVSSWLEDHNFWNLHSTFRMWQPCIEQAWADIR